MTFSYSAEVAPSRPEPTLTLLTSIELESLAVGGCAGSGKAALRSSISFPLSEFLSMTDCRIRSQFPCNFKCVNRA